MSAGARIVDHVLVRTLRRYLKPYRRWLTFVVLFQLISTLAALYLPSLNADIIDNGVAHGDTGYIVRVGAWMLAVSLVQIMASTVAVYFGSRSAMSFGRDLRAALFGRVGLFSAREMAHFGAPSLITRNTNDVQQVQMLVVMGCTLMVGAPIMCVGGIIMAMREDIAMSWLLAVSVPLLATIIAIIVRKLVPQFRSMQVRIDSVNRVLREQISGIRVVRAFVREPEEQRRFGAANDKLTDTSIRAGRLFALMFPTVMLVLNLSSVAVLWIGAGLINDGRTQIGSLTAFLTYLAQILMSVMMATFMVMMIPRAAVCAERIDEVLATDSSVAAPTDPRPAGEERGDIEFRNVTFQYPGAAVPVLTDVNFRVTPGTTTAVVGSTGAGKSTLLSLIPRLFDVSSGELLVDSLDVRSYEPDALWRRIGLIPQKAYLFSGTVASNLRYGDANATDDELWEALRIAQARDFVSAMPGGLDAPIAQGGTNVSGGQRQRLAIARAVVRRPKIYLFDDSFSALDLGTDARLRAALRPAISEAAVLIVASRISTIAQADQIVVLEAGHVVGIGTHDSLVEDCPTYAEIVESQLSAEDAA
jgi:ATP-binding cassette, subfamily B, multidrug efflux pump